MSFLTWVKNKVSHKKKSSTSSPTPNSQSVSSYNNVFAKPTTQSQPQSSRSQTLAFQNAVSKVNKQVVKTPPVKKPTPPWVDNQVADVLTGQNVTPSPSGTVYLNKSKGDKFVKDDQGSVVGYVKHTKYGGVSVGISKNTNVSKNNEPINYAARTFANERGKRDLIMRNPRAFNYLNFVTYNNENTGSRTGVLVSTDKPKVNVKHTIQHKMILGGPTNAYQVITTTKKSVFSQPPISYSVRNPAKQEAYNKKSAFEWNQKHEGTRRWTNVNAAFNPINPANPIMSVGGELTTAALDLTPIKGVKDAFKGKSPGSQYSDAFGHVKNVFSPSWERQNWRRSRRRTFDEYWDVTSIKQLPHVLSLVPRSPAIFAVGATIGGAFGAVATKLSLQAAEGSAIAGDALSGLQVAGAGLGAGVTAKSVVIPFFSNEEKAGKNLFNLALFSAGAGLGAKTGSKFVSERYKPKVDNFKIIKEEGKVNEQDFFNVGKQKGSVSSYEQSAFRVVNKRGSVIGGGKIGVRGEYDYYPKEIKLEDVNNAVDSFTGGGKESVIVKANTGALSKGAYNVRFNLAKAGETVSNEPFAQGEGWSLEEPIHREFWKSDFFRQGEIGGSKIMNKGSGLISYENTFDLSGKSAGVVRTTGESDIVSLNKNTNLLNAGRSKFGSKGIITTGESADNEDLLVSAFSGVTRSGEVASDMGGHFRVNVDSFDNNNLRPNLPEPTGYFDIYGPSEDFETPKTDVGNSLTGDVVKATQKLESVKVSKGLGLDKSIIVKEHVGQVLKDIVVGKSASIVKNVGVLSSVSSKSFVKSESSSPVLKKESKSKIVVKSSPKLKLNIKQNLKTLKQVNVVSKKVNKKVLVSKRAKSNNLGFSRKKLKKSSQSLFGNGSGESLSVSSLTSQRNKGKSRSLGLGKSVSVSHGQREDSKNLLKTSISPINKQDNKKQIKTIVGLDSNQSKKSSKTVIKTGGNPPPPPPPGFPSPIPPPPPIGGGLFMPRFNLPLGRGSFSMRGLSSKRHYTPTITAETLNIFGKRPRRITGFGIRPLQRKKRKKGKRKKKKKR